jgi:2,3-dihydroxyphenylpropionate 1,2-dioxygenase
VLDQLRSGKLKSLIGYDETELDDTGNIELRCWACAAGALGRAQADIVSHRSELASQLRSLAWTGGQQWTPSASPRIFPSY